MKTNPLYEEIYGHLRSDDADDFPAAPGLPVPQFGVEPSPIFSEIFEYQPAAGHAGDDLAKQAELQELRETVLGEDIDIVCATARDSAVVNLEKRAAALAAQAATKYLRIAKNAPTRQRAIEKILNKGRQALLTKGYSGDSEKWAALQGSCEQFVTQSLMAA